MKSFTVPLKVIPEHIVTRCEDCEDFENRGGSYGEYDACLNENYPGYDSDLHRHGHDIPENCPRLNNNNKGTQ